ncbi:MAG: hypothetical protein HRT72_09770 [Flavobacteriales bacterium]|nr:hypothetical protein [Flavobacteriales bacterium]
MNKSKFTEYIESPQELNESDAIELKQLAQEFPYFQIAHMLYAKSLNNIESIQYNSQLKKASAYSSNRERLYELIMHQLLTERITAIDKSISEDIDTAEGIQLQPEDILKIQNEILVEAIDVSASNIETIREDKVEKTIETNNELRSFNDWLKYYPYGSAPKKDATKKKLIDDFLGSGPIEKSSKNGFFSPVNTARLSVIEDESFVTETLAKIYIGQKKYSKAVQAFKQLIVKNPAKSSYFATQIKKIENLKDE